MRRQVLPTAPSPTTTHFIVCIVPKFQLTETSVDFAAPFFTSLFRAEVEVEEVTLSPCILLTGKAANLLADLLSSNDKFSFEKMSSF